MKNVENINGPDGWLIDPHKKWAIHFDCKKGANEENGANINIDMWGVVPSGKPMEFKSRRKATKLDSLKTWKQLVASNWVELDATKIKTA